MSHSITENSTIPEDILWHIFSELVGPIPEPPFSTFKPGHPISLMHAVSQVCSSWRWTAIGAASIWGRLIDIRFLCEQPKWWREEIMARTKDAPLQVYGKLELVDHSAVRAFLGALISKEWHRVESFNVYTMTPAYINDTIWDQLWGQQAPNLMVFRLDLKCSTSALFRAGTIDSILFSNHAPSLRNLSVSFELYLPPSTSWLQGLTTLDIPFCIFSPWILDLIRRTPQLAVLHLSEPACRIEPSSAVVKAEPNTLAPIKMDSLREIDIMCSSIGRLVPLLSILRFQEGVIQRCNIFCREQDTSVSFSHLSAIPSLIRGLFRKVLSSQTYVASVCINLCVDYIDICAGRGRWPSSGYLKDTLFSFIIFSLNLPFPMSILEILDALSKQNMDSITSLLLSLNRDDDAWTTGINPRIALHAFLSQFSGLKTLFLTPQVLRLIHNSIIEDPHILPSLQFVHFQYWFPDIQDLDAFLSRRREIGFPLELLVFPEMVRMENERKDYRCLETYQGLKVAWEPCREDHEYICGSGTPGVLLFEQENPI